MQTASGVASRQDGFEDLLTSFRADLDGVCTTQRYQAAAGQSSAGVPDGPMSIVTFHTMNNLAETAINNKR
eukprot:7334435-Heterocapsa_arctica.AAC.1